MEEFGRRREVKKSLEDVNVGGENWEKTKKKKGKNIFY